MIVLSLFGIFLVGSLSVSAQLRSVEKDRQKPSDSMASLNAIGSRTVIVIRSEEG